MMLSKMPNKSKAFAFALHVLISILLAAGTAALVFLVWFPDDYSVLMKGQRLFTLITVCDVILGPLLTLVIFNPAKSRLAFLVDYAVIGGLQIAALVYGASVIAESRPVFTVFAVDQFELVAASEVNTDPQLNDVPQAPPTAQQLSPSWWGPQLAHLYIESTAAGRNQALDLELRGVQLAGLPAYLRPYRAETLVPKLKPAAGLLQRFPGQRAALERIAARSGVALDALRWLPAKTRFGVHTAVLDAAGTRILGFLELDPY